MSATFEFNCDHGVLTGSKGATRATAVTDNNWKAIDDSSSSFTSAPIGAGANSFSRYLSGKFTGVFNSVGNGFWSANTAGSALGTGITLKGVVSSVYATPSQTTNSALTVNFSSTVPIGSGQIVLFSLTGPEGTPVASITAPGWSQYLITQLQTLGTSGAGTIPTIVGTLEFDES